VPRGHRGMLTAIETFQYVDPSTCRRVQVKAGITNIAQIARPSPHVRAPSLLPTVLVRGAGWRSPARSQTSSLCSPLVAGTG
jgi:hypothetical protein